MSMSSCFGPTDSSEIACAPKPISPQTSIFCWRTQYSIVIGSSCTELSTRHGNNCSALLRQYQPSGKDDQIEKQIFIRRQTHNESLENFCSAVIDLNNQLQVPVRDSKLISVMKSNLKPAQSNMIFGFKIRGLDKIARCRFTIRSRKSTR